MRMSDFIKENRQELKKCISNASGQTSGIDTSEIRLWILNDEGLYNWARSEGVRI